MNPFDQINKGKIGTIFSEKEEFYKLYFIHFQQFWVCKQQVRQKMHIKEVRPMLDDLFEPFERTFIEQTDADTKYFTKIMYLIYICVAA